MRPSMRAFWLFLAAVPASIFMLALAPALLPVIGFYIILLIFLMLIDGFMCTHPREIVFSAEEPSQIPLSATGILTLSMTSAAGQSIPAVEASIKVNDILDQSAQEPVMITPEDGEAHIDLIPKSRGTAEIETLWFRWFGPLKLVIRQTEENPGLTIPIVPNLKRIFANIDALAGAAGSDFGERPHPQQGTGSEFMSLREYIPGMDPRTVDWKRSARYQNLLTKEYEAERNHQIILAFDTGHLMQEHLDGMTRLDHNIDAGLALSHAALRSGDRVGLFAFDEKVHSLIKPVGGVRSFTTLQHHMASMKATNKETNFTLAMTRLAEGLNRRTLVVLFTDFIDTTTAELMQENIIHMARHHLVVFIAAQDPFLHKRAMQTIEDTDDISQAMTAGELLKERRVLFKKLRRHGVLCLEPKSAMMINELLREYRNIMVRELV
ncbi:DUF58 domain-containing protein [Kordiimonas sp. SCSIO 12610]|uniref:DUF58 domain-containing protein n=1 Tax=Kordiimonas sp. SCSIO 12610 TaxID=2829597 RepID=UPI00210F00B2|nr:DUF58 domain-containing protein [Kordiimonas sp. SCSIO 12610]UTW56328.1 DUF58 domain-containing protein [Kordiimonas sp. SCSIO 12610]